MSSSEVPERPAGVPSSAWWKPADREWVLGPKDAAGEPHGEVRYWRPDGTLCCVMQLRHGKPHGPFQRFHETGELAQAGQLENGELHGLRSFFAATGPTTENMYAGGKLSRDVVRMEFDYAHGRFTAIRYFDRDGVRVGADGEPLPPRPEGVPEHAFHNVETGNWVVGAWTGEGRKEGPMEVFGADGRRLGIERYRRGVAHGPTTMFYPDGSPRSVVEYVDGAIDGVVEQFYRNGGLARRARLRDGAWAGPLSDWAPDGQRIAEVTIAPPESVVPRAAPAEASLRGELSVDGIAELSGRRISASGVACLLALGWGGDDERDAVLARVARRAVREIDDPALVEALRDTGLDTAPRLLTAARVERVVAAMRSVDAVDSEVLVFALAERGGVGRSSMLTREDAAGVAALREHVRGDRLDLSEHGLERLPRAIRQLPTLQIVEARRNRLRRVPPELAEVLFLRELNLGHNQLTTLPRELVRLRALRSLSLTRNPLGSLPEVVPMLTELVRLDLSGCGLELLPESLAGVERLRTLWLHDNPLRELPESFAGLRSLRFLHLGGHPWSSPPAVVFELPALRELWLASPSLTQLPEAIGRLDKLERLHVWHSGLTAVPDALFEMTHLRELRIRKNPLPDGTVDRLKEALPDCTIY